eukprot:SAG31_NODE_1403_length_8489_cov_15.730751_3_plen_85_part_00
MRCCCLVVVTTTSCDGDIGTAVTRTNSLDMQSSLEATIASTLNEAGRAWLYATHQFCQTCADSSQSTHVDTDNENRAKHGPIII